MSETVAEETLSAGEIIAPDQLTPEAVNLLERKQMEQFAVDQNTQKEGWYRRTHADWAANIGRWPAGQEKPKPLVPRRVVCVAGPPPPAPFPQLPVWSLAPTDQPVCDELPDPTVVPATGNEVVGPRIQFTDYYSCPVEDTTEIGHVAIRDGYRLQKVERFMTPKNVAGGPGGLYLIVGKAA